MVTPNRRCLDCPAIIPPARKGLRVGQTSRRCESCRRSRRKAVIRRWRTAKLMHRPSRLCAGACGTLLPPHIKSGAAPKYCATCLRVSKHNSQRRSRALTSNRERRRAWLSANSARVDGYRRRHAPRAAERQAAIRNSRTGEERQRHLDQIWMCHVKSRWFNGSPIPTYLVPHLKLIREFRMRASRFCS